VTKPKKIRQEIEKIQALIEIRERVQTILRLLDALIEQLKLKTSWEAGKNG